MEHDTRFYRGPERCFTSDSNRRPLKGFTNATLATRAERSSADRPMSLEQVYKRGLFRPANASRAGIGGGYLECHDAAHIVLCACMHQVAVLESVSVDRFMRFIYRIFSILLCYIFGVYEAKL